MSQLDDDTTEEVSEDDSEPAILPPGPQHIVQRRVSNWEQRRQEQNRAQVVEQPEAAEILRRTVFTSPRSRRIAADPIIPPRRRLVPAADSDNWCF